MIAVPIFRLPHGHGLPLPERATPHAAGLDLRAAIPEEDTWVLAPGERGRYSFGSLYSAHREPGSRPTP